jgi:hypothetical protein
MEDRIQIDGVWYVRETDAIPDPLRMTTIMNSMLLEV